MLTDEQIEAMSPRERRELIFRLERPVHELVSPAMASRLRGIRFGLMITGSLVLIPWVIFLGFTMPSQYVVTNWSLTWIGFDALLVALMAASAYLGWKRRLLFTLTAFATAVMLLCDAWFDITTANQSDRWISIAPALLAEIPFAALLILSTLRIVYVLGSRLWLLPPGKHVWHLELPV